jgi:hypothetical protein
MGIDWWASDPALSSRARDLRDQNQALEERVRRLEAALERAGLPREASREPEVQEHEVGRLARGELDRRLPVLRLEELVPILTDAGLGGIESYYGSHTPAWTALCLRLAGRYGLVPTGGSDFHGRGDHGADLGGVFVPPENIAALEARRMTATV